MRPIACGSSSQHLVVDKDPCCMIEQSSLASGGTPMRLQTLSIRASRRVVVSSPKPTTAFIGSEAASEATLRVVSFHVSFIAHLSQRGSSFDSTDALEETRIRDFNMHRVFPLHVFRPSYGFCISTSASVDSTSTTHPNRQLYGQSTCPSRAPTPL